MQTQDPTPQRILEAALKLFFSQGIGKTSMEEIAEAAGMTRITVYRYFENKAALVEAVLGQVLSALEAVQIEIDGQPDLDPEAALDHIVTGLSALPTGDFPVLLLEVQRRYPQAAQRFGEKRRALINNIFEKLFESARLQGRLRPGLARPLVQAYFLSAVVSVLENPSLLQEQFSAAEVFAAVKEIFLHGILTADKHKRETDE